MCERLVFVRKCRVSLLVILMFACGCVVLGFLFELLCLRLICCVVLFVTCCSIRGWCDCVFDSSCVIVCECVALDPLCFLFVCVGVALTCCVLLLAFVLG